MQVCNICLREEEAWEHHRSNAGRHDYEPGETLPDVEKPSVTAAAEPTCGECQRPKSSHRGRIGHKFIQSAREQYAPKQRAKPALQNLREAVEEVGAAQAKVASAAKRASKALVKASTTKAKPAIEKIIDDLTERIETQISVVRNAEEQARYEAVKLNTLQLSLSVVREAAEL